MPRQTVPRSSLLAALPHLLVAFLLGLAEAGLFVNLIPEDSPLTLPIVLTIWLAIGGGLLGVLLSARRSGWPDWSGAWIAYFGLALFVALGFLSTLLSAQDWLNRYNLFILVIGGGVAFGLYSITRRNALHGLLAGLTVVAFTGLPWLESVPSGLRAGVTVCAWLALAGASALVVWAAALRRALLPALAGSLVILLPFAWVGIYHGGMLNFDVPGPSALQVARSALPLFSLAGCLLLGPQLARQVRLLDLRSHPNVLWPHRLALLGELFLLSGAVVIFWKHQSANLRGVSGAGWFLLAAGFALACLGLVLVFASASSPPGRLWTAGWAAGLTLALLSLPWALLASLPSPLEYAARTTGRFPPALPYYPEFGLHLTALLWVGLSAWVIWNGEQGLSSTSQAGSPAS